MASKATSPLNVHNTHGRLSSWERTPAGSRISLCMIVRDEAENLPRCLDSAIPYVDEVVVVDTGSTDDTVAIAQSKGAKIGHFPWVGDFARARNASLDLATGDWFLVLDADEILQASTAKHLRSLVASAANSRAQPKDRVGVDEPRTPAPARGFTLLVRSETAYGTTDDMQVRLCEACPGVRFAGVIHETFVGPSATQIDITPATSVVVLHSGYTSDVMERRQKMRRNSELLATALDRDPLDAYLLYKAAQHALTENDFAGALRLGTVAIDVSARGDASRGPLGTSNLADTYRTLIAANLALNDVDGAVAIAERGVQDCPNHAPLWTQVGLALLGAKQPVRALAAFREARSRRDTPHFGAIDRASVGWRALYGMGEAFLELNQPAEARPVLIQALIDAPFHPLVVRALAIAEERTGEVQDSYDRLDAAVRRYPDDVDLRRALAGLLQRVGHPEDAVRVLAPLIDRSDISPDIFDELAASLEANGQVEDADNARAIAQRRRSGAAEPVSVAGDRQ